MSDCIPEAIPDKRIIFKLVDNKIRTLYTKNTSFLVNTEFCNALKINTSLERLILMEGGNINITLYNFEYILNKIIYKSNIETIILVFTILDNFDFLRNYMLNNINITNLCLCFNKITNLDSFIKTYKEILTYNHILTKIGFKLFDNNNEQQIIYINAIIDFLKYNISIKKLAIFNINDNALNILLEFLKTDTIITYIVIRSISDINIDNLIDTLNYNNTLKKIEIMESNIKNMDDNKLQFFKDKNINLIIK